jgi:hypothetical protein
MVTSISGEPTTSIFRARKMKIYGTSYFKCVIMTHHATLISKPDVVRTFLQVHV